MDDKYKFKINKEELKDEEIRKHQNFDGLMTDFRKARIAQKKVVPFHKKRVVVYTTVAAAAFLFLVGTLGYFSLFIGMKMLNWQKQNHLPMIFELKALSKKQHRLNLLRI